MQNASQNIWKNIILCILKGKMPFKKHKIIFFFPELKKKICVPTLPKIFRPVTRTHTYFFIWSHYSSTFVVHQVSTSLCLTNVLLACLNSLRPCQHFSRYKGGGLPWVEPVLCRGLSVLFKETTHNLHWSWNQQTFDFCLDLPATFSLTNYHKTSS